MSTVALVVFMAIQSAAGVFYVVRAVREWKRRALLSEECDHVLTMPVGEERHARRMELLKRLHELERA